MKKPSRFLRILGVAGLLVSLLAATIAPVAAQPLDDTFLETLYESNPGMFLGDNTIYYPWVANGEDFGLGASQTSTTVQNLENASTTITILVGDGSSYSEVTTAFLAPFASKSFTASQLGIPEGDGAPVIVHSTDVDELDGVIYDLEDFGLTAGDPLFETAIELSNPLDAAGDDTQVNACGVEDEDGQPVGFRVAAAFSFEGEDYAPGDWYIDAYTSDDLQEILENANLDNTSNELINPFGGLNDDADCDDEGVVGPQASVLTEVAIAGVAKQAVAGQSLPSTTSADTSVSGYNAINGVELSDAGAWYLPIVQTNCGPGGCWDTVIRVANYETSNTAVEIEFFASSDGEGSLQTGFVENYLVDGGDTVTINLSDLVPEDWVGSAHITSDGAVFAMADRFKTGTDMWITNAGSSADFENAAQVDGANGRFALFAPHVLLDHNGWNTGINVANLVNEDNQVSIQYFNMIGGNQTEVWNQRLAANGMGYYYDPSQPGQDSNNQDVTTDVTANVVGSAIIWSEHPVAAAVDATKYAVTDPNGGADVGHATSYSATQNLFTWQAVPLVQKGNPDTGMGDTSGINIMNPNNALATVDVFYFSPTGNSAQNFGVSGVSIAPFANGFVYTMTQANLPNGFEGSAQLRSNVPVVAVSANVNYAVDGDGGAGLFNAFNPCGLFRVQGGCSFGAPFEDDDQSFTKTWEDEWGDPVEGVQYTIELTDGSTSVPFERTGTSQADGALTMENLPAGVYELTVDELPDGFALEGDVAVEDFVEPFTVGDGESVSLTNVLMEEADDVPEDETGSVTKTFEETNGVPIMGVEFTIIPPADGAGDPLDGLSNAEGTFTFDEVPVGDYELIVTGVPDAFELPQGVQDTFSVTTNENTPLTNVLERSTNFSTTACVGTRDDTPSQIQCSDTNLIGVGMVIYNDIGDGEPEAGEEEVFRGVTGPDGTLSLGLPPGDYVLCLFDEDGTADTINGEAVEVLLPADRLPGDFCNELPPFLGGGSGLDDFFSKAFSIEEGSDLMLDNPILVQNGSLDFFVGTAGGDGLSVSLAQLDGLEPIEGIDMCLDSYWNGPLGCSTSDENGQVTFPIAGADDPFSVDNDEFGAAGEYVLEIYSDDYAIDCASTGELNVFSLYVGEECEDAEPAGHTLQQGEVQEYRGYFAFAYDPTLDIAQDGYLSDVGADGSLRGGYDLAIQFDSGEPVEPGETFTYTLNFMVDCASGEMAANDTGSVSVCDPGFTVFVADFVLFSPGNEYLGTFNMDENGQSVLELEEEGVYDVNAHYWTNGPGGTTDDYEATVAVTVTEGGATDILLD